MTKNNDMNDGQVSSDAATAKERSSEAAKKTGNDGTADKQSDLWSVEDYWYRSLTTRGVDPDAAERIIRAAQSHPVLVEGDPSREEITSLTREGINMIDLTGEGIEEPRPVREEMREALDEGLNGRIPGPMSLTTPYDVQVASATGPAGDVILSDSERDGDVLPADIATTSNQTSPDPADTEERNSQKGDSDEDNYEVLITRTFKNQGEAKLKAAEELGYEVTNSSEVQEQTTLDSELVANFADRIEKFEDSSQSEAAQALGTLVTLRDTNTKQNTARELVERVKENPTRQHYTQALAGLLSHHDDLTLQEESIHAEASDSASETGQATVRGSERSAGNKSPASSESDGLPEVVATGKENFVELIENGDMTLEEFEQMSDEVVREISSSGSE